MRERKARLRDRYCDLRECLPGEEVQEASAALCHRLAEMEALREAQTVLSYLAFKNEPDLGLLFVFVKRLLYREGYSG